MDANDIARSLQRIEGLLEVIAKSSVVEVLERELADPKMAQLYELTGKVTAQEATKLLSCSKTTVSDAWKRWESKGLIRKCGKGYERVL